METLAQIPEWLGTAIFAALSAIVGFFGRNLWDWWKRRNESAQHRRARLELLDRLLDESAALFKSQRSQAGRLLASLRQTQPSVVTPRSSLDQIFSRAFQALTHEEAQIHAIIRGVTESSLKRVNSEMAAWLQEDDWFKQAKHSSEQLNELAGKLQLLQLHLSEWNAKFSSVFERDQTVALNYLADEQQQGTGFPVGIEKVVKHVLTARAGLV